MGDRMVGKVAFITGAARGQGRSHAVRLAEEGADIIAVDLCAQVSSVPYPMSTPEDLAETVREVEALDRRIVATQADVRDYGALQKALAEGVAALGRLDIVCANAGIVSYGAAVDLDETTWQDIIDINLTGVWHTCQAAVPHLGEAGHGRHHVVARLAWATRATSATTSAAKHGVVGLMRTLANELAPDSIRVNSVNPTNVSTDMLHNDALYQVFRPDLDHPTVEDAIPAFTRLNAIPVPWVEPQRHQQCGAVPAQRREPLRDRGGAAGGRRVHAALTLQPDRQAPRSDGGLAVGTGQIGRRPP